MTWFELTTGPALMQGDLIPSIGIPIPAGSAEEFAASDDPPIEVIEMDVVVMSQSCDLEQDKTEWVVVAQYAPWKDMAVGMGRNRRLDMQKQIRRGRVPHYALLREDAQLEWSVVDFRRLFTLPIGYLQTHAAGLGDRLRMLSPYREDIAQAFARYFMRVALPIDPVEFDIWDPPPPPPDLAGDAQ